MNENLTTVLHGFFNLTMKEKMQLVEAMNEYFDSTTREPIREANEVEFQKIGLDGEKKTCKCCGR
ncbi:MAG: hypothetical protein AAB336_00040 [Acidobacteriota bacterium]